MSSFIVTYIYSSFILYIFFTCSLFFFIPLASTIYLCLCTLRIPVYTLNVLRRYAVSDRYCFRLRLHRLRQKVKSQTCPRTKYENTPITFPLSIPSIFPVHPVVYHLSYLRSDSISLFLSNLFCKVSFLPIRSQSVFSTYIQIFQTNLFAYSFVLLFILLFWVFAATWIITPSTLLDHSCHFNHDIFSFRVGKLNYKL